MARFKFIVHHSWLNSCFFQTANKMCVVCSCLGIPWHWKECGLVFVRRALQVYCYSHISSWCRSAPPDFLYTCFVIATALPFLYSRNRNNFCYCLLWKFAWSEVPIHGQAASLHGYIRSCWRRLSWHSSASPFASEYNYWGSLLSSFLSLVWYLVVLILHVDNHLASVTIVI
jgi:hypothetical protein